MKKFKKKELLAVVADLKKNNEVVRNQGKNPSLVMKLLMQCQELAICIGSYLETCGTSGKNITNMLEEYCENLYQMSIKLKDDDKFRVLTEIIEKNLIQIEDRIRNKIPEDKKNIIFFPYKASMWDSMESIWKEAVKDSHCAAYVVPIPYYDKKIDGSLGQMHYEGDELPGNVKITDWKDFILDEWCADVAYIHNPYDNWNKVTSVYPDFYIKNLREKVSKIVYVPYFSTMNQIDKHFCILPGVLYSDAVVLQTEKIKQTYIEELYKFERENGLNGFFAKDKFFVFGSPKFDKVVNVEVEGYKIPEEWKNLIYREDGSKKKIVLFNTSVQELILYKSVQIEKIKQVINLFNQYEDLVLLWRPHPLNESTVKAMMPQLLQEYIDVERTFKEEQKGIFDDSADLHRAIAVSDAYYGTGGSLISLYGLTGKPIMREDTQLLDIEDTIRNRCVSFESAFIDDKGMLWFSAVEFNSLFKYNIEKDELEWMGNFPGEAYNGRYLYSRGVYYNGKLYFPPYTAEEFAVYIINTGEFYKIPLNTYGVKGRKTYGIVQYNGKLFCFGAILPAIVCLDLGTEEITYYEDVHKELSEFSIDENPPIINRDIVVEGNKCILSCGRSNAVVEFCMDDMSYKIHHIGKADNYYIGMKKFRNKIYLLPRNAANIVCWDSESNVTYEVKAQDNHCEENAYFNACEYDDELWLFAFKGQHISKIARNKEEVEVIEEMSSYEKDDIFHENTKKFNTQKISWAHSDDAYIYYFSAMDRSLYVRNGKTGELIKRHLVMDIKDFRKAYVSHIFKDRENCNTAQQCIYIENSKLTLADYIEWMHTLTVLKSEKQAQLFIAENAEGHTDCGILCHERFDLEE